MEGLDKEMARILGTDHPFLAELNQRIMANPGKRLRPKLLVLCSKLLNYEGEDGPLYGAVFELIHTATLIHDDIIDEAKTRRGNNTMNNVLGNTITVLYGDLLYTKAHSTAIEGGRLDVLHTITWVSERMIEGELLQYRINYDSTITEETYFDVLQRKTAYLFAGTTKAAGLIADLPTEKVQQLYDYGFNLGISFQLIDDYLDYTGSEDELGKPVLQDLREGKITLPLIKLLKKDDGRLRDLIHAFWDDANAAVPPALLEALHADSSLQETWELAKAYAEKAIQALDGFEQNEIWHILTTMPLQLLHRHK
ncbi:Polyprenyl synthetase family protein [Sulfidibacter corallicola]|uniref:Polyprenyl synthetase family protein n=1 Tax=Sulfidibacter corallicola TaxID=2818388 RepID=A0A8A4TUB1_SULCO|nr:polyprenyl synthetase family protein [Sulfidibacter corallicola]QTD52724.1 polyprenyl synthetase family protein [Sulfidibacter corallicola]